ncbi:hypothetical protein ACLB2K_004810 [Fragaria x ananassa]
MHPHTPDLLPYQHLPSLYLLLPHRNYFTALTTHLTPSIWPWRRRQRLLMNLLVGPVEEQIQDEYRRDILDVARGSFATSSPENTERHRRTLSFGSETNAGFLRTVVPSSVMTKFAAKVDANDVGDGADDEECNTATNQMSAQRQRSGVVLPSSSLFVTQTVNGSHQFLIKGYSLAKGIGVGKHIASENFKIGGYQWAIYFYPDGKNPEDNSAYVSVFIALASEGTDVRALFELTLVDQGPDAKHKVHSHFDRSLESGPYTLKYRGSMWGYKRFYRRTMLESSTFVKDDCLKINCTVGVVVSAIDSSRLHSILVPDSDIGAHFGTFLENGEGSDVTFIVSGVKFLAHKLVLAARSPEFGNEFFSGLEEDNQEIVVNDMEPKVFKALLHFLYTDTLVEDEEFSEPSSSSCMPSLSDVLAAKLLAAADKYGLTRLRLMCESVLCKDISVNSVANILALADRYSAFELKSVCLKFAAENLVAVMETDGFELLKENCPLLQSELLKTVAGSEEELSAGGKSQSVWAQFSDGGNSNDRRARQQTLQNGERGQRIWVQSLDGSDARGMSPGQEAEV